MPLSRETALAILADYATGIDPLDTYAQRHGTKGATLRDLAVRDEEVGAAYARARIVSAGSFEDEVARIAKHATAESYQADTLRVNSYKWLAAKRDPRRYSDKVDITTDGQSMVSGVIVMPAPLPVGAPGIAATARIAPQATVTRQLGASNVEGYAAQEDSHDDAPHNAT